MSRLYKLFNKLLHDLIVHLKIYNQSTLELNRFRINFFDIFLILVTEFISILY